MVKPCIFTELLRNEDTSLLVGFNRTGSYDEKLCGTSLFPSERFELFGKVFPFLFGKYIKAAVETDSDDEAETEAFTELCGESHSALNVNSMFISTHQRVSAQVLHRLSTSFSKGFPHFYLSKYRYIRYFGSGFARFPHIFTHQFSTQCGKHGGNSPLRPTLWDISPL